MLQQTRVETVIPYYHRFLDRFPTVDSLAAAPVEEVLGLWSGLGYYRRARQLHAAAVAVAAAGDFPTTAEELRSLPGIGPYTAAAVASIAFDEVVAVLDGNVERVMCRRLGLADDPKRAAVARRLRAAAAALLDPRRPGDGNQALMELGATVCTPRLPACDACPLERGCAAAELGTPEGFPRARKRRRPVRRRLLVAVVRSGGRLLLFRRPDDAPLMAGLWELPWIDRESPGRPQSALAARYGGRWRLGPTRGQVRHSVTYRAFEIDVRVARLESSDEVAEGREAGWFRPDELDRLPLSSLVAKALSKAAEPG